MDPTLQADATDVLASVGRHWGWVLAFGIVTLLAGILALAWMGRTVMGPGRAVRRPAGGGRDLPVRGRAGDRDETGATRVLLALLGVLSFIVGLYAPRHILVTIATLALLLGIFWIVNGAIEVFTALSHRRMPGRGWTIPMGLLSVVAGVAVLVYPGVSLVTLAVVLGVWLLVFGMMEVGLAFRLRSIGQGAARIATAT